MFGRKKHQGGYNNYEPPKPYKRSHKPVFEARNPGSIIGGILSNLVDLSNYDKIYNDNGKKYYGKNDGENTTDYWDEDGNLEFSKNTDEYDENERDIEEWEKLESHRECEEDEERSREEDGYFD